MVHLLETHRLRQGIELGSVNFLGKPFAGKDVQAELFAHEVGGKSLGAGPILRGGHDSLSLEDQTILDAGGLVPSNTFRRAITPELRRYANQPLFLSGVGRMLGEPLPLIEALAEVGHPLRAVVYLNISDEELFRRSANRQRVDPNGASRIDDAREIIEHRVAAFNEQTLPALEEYRASDVPYIELLADGLSKRQAHQLARRALVAILRP